MIVAFIAGVVVGIGGFWLWLEWPFMTEARRDKWYQDHMHYTMSEYKRQWELLDEEERRLCKLNGREWDFWGAKWADKR